MELPVPDSFEVLERLPGHVPTMGKSAGQELNWAYCLRARDSKEKCIGMFCKPNHLTLISTETWEILQLEDYKYITWYIAPVGYVTRTVKANDPVPYTFLHQMILNHARKGRGQESIDHINQNKLDNRTTNLRITSQSVQNANRGKVARHRTARPLPEGIEGPLPKFCVYYKECYNKEKNLWREFFTVEGHPTQAGARKATTKSGKVGLQEKLKEAKEILAALGS
jgi:hypothetical protein